MGAELFHEDGRTDRQTDRWRDMTKLTVACLRSGIQTNYEEDVEFLNVKPDGILRHSVGVVAYFYSPLSTVVSLFFSFCITRDLFKFCMLWHVTLCILVPSFLFGLNLQTTATSIGTAVRISNLKCFTSFSTFFLS